MEAIIRAGGISFVVGMACAFGAAALLKKDPGKFPLQQVAGSMDREITSGEDFTVTFEFKKIRDDCSMPTATRYIIDNHDGFTYKLPQRPIIQYKADRDSLQRISLDLPAPDVHSSKAHMLVSDITYVCNGHELNDTFYVGPFFILPKDE